ncbi:hypothetical protein Nepgr_019148 [Nepenthes gracilis]|uniref:Bifunctional inhibitor/plant lipid transfer protein/seed storage helical domain-containing protein n=1 Tax=Nepenthes gracilis TaxID=150966 RepID=A0AAD3XTS6_NEPGR|nr:hypothetical protein Nepgr_019148 [Nepenthes gracilis]
MAGHKAQLVGLLAIVLLLSGGAVATLPCPLLIISLSPCFSFFSNKSSAPSSHCCNSLQQIACKINSPSDRKKNCQCLKAMLIHLSCYDPNRVSQLPQKCGVANLILPPITKDTDCCK